ncbi:PREDICTED: protein IWS1 homolog [Amphimedon queenslandica]|nr:PREDICTED: protein IWS1 homolog [Amphimedon queenslandica]|eukprot:XP_011402722.1 PREDICTED: protein IWS1 homolog [Amphimedon queenslandica]
MKETIEEDDDNDGQLLEEKEGRGDDDDDDEEQEGSAEHLEQLENELLGLEQSENLQAPGGSGGHHSSDSELEDSKEPKVYDFDVMMQRRKEAMARARRKKKNDSDSTAYDDQILVMIRHMKEAAEEDRRSNLQQKAATKKLQFLPTVIAHLKKSEFLNALIECGICSALADWLKPLPDHSLPHQKIRENILDALKLFPLLDGHILKTSGLGKAIMLLYRHPKEIKKNREKAGKLINKWARPVFGLTDDFKGLSRDEREERDWAHLSQAARRRLSSDSRESDPSRQDELEALKPGDKGWVGRARVPLPSNKDYVVRPKWNKQHEFSKGSSKKTLNRYEKQVQKKREKTARGKNTHAVSISIEGRKMPL